MKTIDTTKPWVVNPETESVVPEICGPAGICMDVHGATTEQAQEIADTLNPLTGEGQLAEFREPYSVTLRAGDCGATYSGPDAAGVVEMMLAAEHRVESTPSDIVINISKSDDVSAGEASAILSQAMERGAAPDESSQPREILFAGKRQGGKTAAMLLDAYTRINKLKVELAAANEHAGNLLYERDAWKANAASYLGSMHWYQEQLDICARAIGVEAFTCDDGGKSDTPLRAKVAELVVRMCAERNPAQRMMNSGITPQPPTEFDYAVAGPLSDAQRVQVDRALTELKRGPCAKQTVTATIITPTGERFVGTNDCANPQTTCPRDAAGMKTGEGYHICREVCRQTGHAEINALRAAGEKARGATMYIEGHTYACGSCQEALTKAGVEWIFFRPARGV